MPKKRTRSQFQLRDFVKKEEVTMDVDDVDEADCVFESSSLRRKKRHSGGGGGSKKLSVRPSLPVAKSKIGKRTALSTRSETRQWSFDRASRLNSILQSGSGARLGIMPMRSSSSPSSSPGSGSSSSPEEEEESPSPASSSSSPEAGGGDNFSPPPHIPHKLTSEGRLMMKRRLVDGPTPATVFVQHPVTKRVHKLRMSAVNQRKSTTYLRISSSPRRARTDAVFQDNYQPNKKKRGTGIDLFNNLPDEMMLRVLSFLPKSTLGRVGQVSKRLYRLSQDDTLWTRIDCMAAVLDQVQLEAMMRKRPEYLRMSRAFVSPLADIVINNSALKYLDLSMTVIDPKLLANILKNSGATLEKLSLEHVKINKEVTEAMQGLINLDVLDMALCYGHIEADSLAIAFSNMSNLTQLNLSCLGLEVNAPSGPWTEEDITTIVTALPPTLEMLNMSGYRYIMKDTHVEMICNKLRPSIVELDLSDSQFMTGKCVEYFLTLKHLQHLSLSRCYSIDPHTYPLLQALTPTLRYLDLFSLFKDTTLKTLSATLPGLTLNHFPFSAVARPTVGNKRSSIWGVRVRFT